MEENSRANRPVGESSLSGPDLGDARRRKLLNILLLGTAIAAFVAMVVAIVIDLVGGNVESPQAFYVGAPIVLVGILVIAVINRKGPERWASIAFLALFIAVTAFSDTPKEVIAGRSSFVLALPIVMASVLLPPYASFIVAGVVSLVTVGISLSIGRWGNPFTIIIFFVYALVSWLAAHSLEQVSEGLRETNTALRLRVEQLAALGQASQVVTASLELRQVLAEIVSLASEVVKSGYTSVVLVDDEGRLGESAENVPGVPALEYRIRADGLTRWIVHSKQPAIVDEIYEDGRMMPHPGEGAPRLANPPIVESGIKSLAGLPLVVKGRLLGVLYLHSLQVGAFHDQLPLLTAFANQVAIAIENARLYGAAQQELLERERVERALRESEERYRRITDAITDYIYTVHVQDGNPIETMHGLACVAVTGYTVEEFHANPYLWIEMVHPEDREAVRKQAAHIVAGLEVEPLEHRVFHKDGSMRWVRNTPVPQYESEGKLISYDGLIQDITERKHLEEQIRQQERLAAIGQLAGGIAHDFNNFLTTIMLYAQIALRKPQLSPDLRPHLETILDESRQAARLVRQVLDFSRRSVMESQPVDLVVSVKGTVDILRRTLPENIRLLIGVGSDECVINADPARIQQVVMNLALNARDAMPEGGELFIGLAGVEVAPGESPPVDGMPAGAWAHMTVSDTGVGIADEARSHLFEPFFTTKGPGKGTGLGLAQVHGIVTQHGGYIDFETGLGQGTAFHIYLPAYRETIRKDLEEVPDVARGTGESILIVEDEQNVREAGREILEALGYQVLIAANGREALEMYRGGERLDLVLTDLVMPEMGGGELVRALRKLDPHIKVLAITGYTVAEDLNKLRDAGILDIIQKPLDASTLSRAVRQALDAN